MEFLKADTDLDVRILSPLNTPIRPDSKKSTPQIQVISIPNVGFIRSLIASSLD